MHLLGGQTWQRWTWEERRSAITPCRSMAPCCHHTSPRHRCQDSQSSDGRTWSLRGAIRNLLSNVGRARSGGGGVLLNPISKLKSGPDGSDGKHGTTQSRRLGPRLLRLYWGTHLRLYRAYIVERNSSGLQRAAGARVALWGTSMVYTATRHRLFRRRGETS